MMAKMKITLGMETPRSRCSTSTVCTAIIVLLGFHSAQFLLEKWVCLCFPDHLDIVGMGYGCLTPKKSR